MPHAQIEIARVRGDSEGLLTKPVKIKEHGSYLPPFGIAASTETFSNCSTSSAVRRVGSRKSARKAAPTLNRAATEPPRSTNSHEDAGVKGGTVAASAMDKLTMRLRSS